MLFFGYNVCTILLVVFSIKSVDIYERIGQRKASFKEIAQDLVNHVNEPLELKWWFGVVATALSECNIETLLKTTSPFPIKNLDK